MYHAPIPAAARALVHGFDQKNLGSIPDELSSMYIDRGMLKTHRSMLPLTMPNPIQFTLFQAYAPLHRPPGAVVCTIFNMRFLSTDSTCDPCYNEESTGVFVVLPKLLHRLEPECDDAAKFFVSDSLAIDEHASSTSQNTHLLAEECFERSNFRVPNLGGSHDGLERDAVPVSGDGIGNSDTSDAGDCRLDESDLIGLKDMLDANCIDENSPPLSEVFNLEYSIFAERDLSLSPFEAASSQTERFGHQKTYPELPGSRRESLGPRFNSSFYMLAGTETENSSDSLQTGSGEFELFPPEIRSMQSCQISSAGSKNISRSSHPIKPPTRVSLGHVPRNRGPKARRRSAYAAAQRDKVNAVRKASACIRCQMLKEPVRALRAGHGNHLTSSQCSDTAATEACQRCIEIASSAKIWRMPCVRARLTDVQIFRTGTSAA
jgi:hypothetical protein